MIATRARNLTFLFANLLHGAAFDSSHWRFVAPVRVPESGRLCVVPLDRALYSRLRQDLGDLRIVELSFAARGFCCEHSLRDN
jgi:hypothetical protein